MELLKAERKVQWPLLQLLWKSFWFVFEKLNFGPQHFNDESYVVSIYNSWDETYLFLTIAMFIYRSSLLWGFLANYLMIQGRCIDAQLRPI